MAPNCQRSVWKIKYQELLEKYGHLLGDNRRLTEENRQLRAQLGIARSDCPESGVGQTTAKTILADTPSPEGNSFRNITRASDAVSKIELFMSRFKGRDDVFASRWENQSKNTSGYSPVCLNQWKAGLCGKPKMSCRKCANKSYAALNKHVIEAHLRGNMVVGIYPLLPDETCCFLAMDFDDADWPSDIATVRELCNELDIPIAVERSRSGNGGHIWFFFENRISAVLARKFGTALVTHSMTRRHEIRFKSYDRLFPSQDTIPRGGFGNLIALPLQQSARKNHNSEFVDENFESYADQWAYLSSVKLISEDRLEGFISALCQGHELGMLKIDEEDTEKPWETHQCRLKKSDFPTQIGIVKANMLFIPKAGISQRGLNRLKRLASFKNPMFYKLQAMRLSTFKHSRVISCADETTEYLCLPRGCENDLLTEFKTLGVNISWTDKTNRGKPINVEFNGRLRDEQSLALDQLMRHDTGILSGTTAFGKTVVAIRLIAERKVNTLVLVDKVSLLSQWKEKISKFLTIKETLPKTAESTVKKKGRKDPIDAIGQLGGGINLLSGIVDIAVMQSLIRGREVKDCVKTYGMVIADECHHAPAFSYESILKAANARYVYGLTATPARKDGHHPILFMQCGPIRYRDNAKKQAENRPFDHYIIPRFTFLRVPSGHDDREVSIQELYSEIVENEFRNQQIVQDVLTCHRQGRNCIILSLRTAHVESLAKKLKEEVPEVVTLTGGMGAKTTREVFDRIRHTPTSRNLLLVATGPFIGEGFDEPRLDTLFLAMPISWKGTLQQYAGRLHRLFADKKDVCIYDYVDIHVKMLEKMYQKRLAGYAAMGYKAKAGEIMSTPLDIIFDKENFLPVFIGDIARAKKEILIVSPFVRKLRSIEMLQHLKIALENNIQVIVVTRPIADFKAKDQPALDKTIALLNNSGIRMVFKSNIHQKFAITDQRIVWYGSANFLSYGSAQESIMRIESPSIAYELSKVILGQA
jgi:superfamily II DNA or RNA helicase